MKVLKGINGEKKALDMSYEAICEELGFLSDVQFVKVTKGGYISFWAGKRSEISALADAVVQHSYYPSEGLRLMFPDFFRICGY